MFSLSYTSLVIFSTYSILLVLVSMYPFVKGPITYIPRVWLGDNGVVFDIFLLCWGSSMWRSSLLLGFTSWETLSPLSSQILQNYQIVMWARSPILYFENKLETHFLYLILISRLLCWLQTSLGGFFYFSFKLSID